MHVLKNNHSNISYRNFTNVADNMENDECEENCEPPSEFLRF